MKAIFFEQHGGPEVLKYAEIPTPSPKKGEALVKVKAVALNHLDIWVRRGWAGLHLDMPHIGGSDIVGEIVEVNAESSWTPGARVVLNPGISLEDDEWTRRGKDSLSPSYKILGEQTKGGLAEYVTVPVQNVFHAPEGISDEEAVAPLLVGLTSWRMLFKRACLKPGESVLVVGAGGGVNSISILIAKAAGATVYCLAGGKSKVEKAKLLGADFVIDYIEHRSWHAEVLKLTKGRGVDVVIDNVGAETFSKSLRAATRGGRIVTVGNTKGHEITFDNRVVFAKQLSILGSTMGSRQDFIDAIAFIYRLDLRHTIDRVESLSEGIKMLQRLESGEQFGKIILRP